MDVDVDVDVDVEPLYFFLFDHFLEARAEIMKIISFGFGEN